MVTLTLICTVDQKPFKLEFNDPVNWELIKLMLKSTDAKCPEHTLIYNYDGEE